MKPFTTLTVLLLFAIAVAHVLRFLNGWQVTLAGRSVPMWVSALGAVIAAALAILVWREQRRR